MTDPAGGLNTERLLTTLSGDLAVLRRRVEALEAGDQPARLDVLAIELRRVTTAVEVLSAAEAAEQVRVWNWQTMTAAEAGEAWKELLDWMRGWLVLRVPSVLSGSRSEWKPCWYKHPDVVDELSVLYATWRYAYEDPGAPPTRAAEWWDRWLPAALARISRSTHSCGRGRASPAYGDDGHKAPNEYRVPLADDAELSTYVQADLAARNKQNSP